MSSDIEIKPYKTIILIIKEVTVWKCRNRHVEVISSWATGFCVGTGKL